MSIRSRRAFLAALVGTVALTGAALVNSPAQAQWKLATAQAACYKQNGVSYLAVDGSTHATPAPGDATVTHWSQDGVGDLTTTMPAGPFNPATADPRWLPLLAIPARPAEAAAAAEWLAKFDRVWHFQQASDMCPTDGMNNSPVRTRIWSGIVDTDHPDYNDALGDVYVPFMTPSCASNASLSLWTGLGGGDGGGLIQNGIEADNNITTGMYAWWEVLSTNRSVNIIPVSGRTFATAADEIFLETNYDNSTGRVDFSWFNYTTSTAITPVSMVNIIWTNPVKQAGLVSEAYDGNTAEFINERTSYLVNDVNTPSPLIQYSDHLWANTSVGVGNSQYYANQVPHGEYDIYDTNTLTVPLSYIVDHATHYPSNWTMHWHQCQ